MRPTKTPFLPLFLAVLLVPLVFGITLIPAIADNPCTYADLAAGSVTQIPSNQGYVPFSGLVPDSTTAVQIAVAVWIPIYGVAHVRSEQPYVAKLKGNVWTVTGTLPTGRIGGMAEARIAKRDGRVLFVNHSQ